MLDSLPVSKALRLWAPLQWTFLRLLYTSLVEALHPTCGIMEPWAWHGLDLQAWEHQNPLSQKGTLWVGQAQSGMEKVIREPKAWQGCGQEGQTKGKSALEKREKREKSSFSILDHWKYTQTWCWWRELRADSEEGVGTSTDKDHGQGHRTKAPPQAWKYMAMFHSIPTAVLTRRKFINNNSLSSHGADSLDFHHCLHMHYFLLMLLFLAADTYL